MEASEPKSDPVARSNRTVLLILGSVLVVVLLGVIVFLVTRTSEEEKALQAVCGARQDIAERVDRLAATNVANFTLDGFRADVSGIGNDLRTIKENEPKLGVDRKQQITQANQQFGSEISNVLSTLGRSLSLENAEAKLKTAGQQLVESYKQTLAPVDCSGVDTSG